MTNKCHCQLLVENLKTNFSQRHNPLASFLQPNNFKNSRKMPFLERFFLRPRCLKSVESHYRFTTPIIFVAHFNSSGPIHLASVISAFCFFFDYCKPFVTHAFTKLKLKAPAYSVCGIHNGDTICIVCYL